MQMAHTDKQGITGEGCSSREEVESRSPSSLLVCLMPAARARVALKRREEYYKCSWGSIFLTKGVWEEAENSTQDLSYSWPWKHLQQKGCGNWGGMDKPCSFGKSCDLRGWRTETLTPPAPLLSPFLLGTECREGKNSTALTRHV